MEFGGYTPFHPLTWHDQKVFETVYDKLDGVGYVPHAVSTQLVSQAVNYRFLCTQTIITAKPITNIVIVDIKGEAATVTVLTPPTA